VLHDLSSLLPWLLIQRVHKHNKYAHAFRKSIESIGLKIIPVSEKVASNTLSAVYYPENVDGNQFLKHVSDYGVIIAGGLLADIKTTYFRVGHMGSVNTCDIIAVLSAIEYSLLKTGYDYTQGKSLETFQKLI